MARSSLRAAALAAALLLAVCTGARALPGAITALAYSPDGKRLAVGAVGEVALYDTATWQPVATLKQITEAVRALAFSPDGKWLAVGSGLPARNGVVALWDVTNPSSAPRALTEQKDTVEAVAFRKDGKALLVASDDNTARYYPSLPDNANKLLDEHNDRVDAVAFSPRDGWIYITGALDRVVKVWDPATNHTVVNFDQSEGGITGLVFLDNGSQFVGSSLDGKLYWWGVGYDQRKKTFGGYHFRTIEAHDDGVLCLAGAANGRRLISGGVDSVVRIWNPDGGKEREFKDATQPIYAVALSPDAKFAAAGGREGMVRIWDIEANKLATSFTPAPVTATKQSAHR